MDRITQFTNMRLGLFIHFGLYSSFELGEWSYYVYDSVRKDYKKAFEEFNPTKLDFDNIAKLAKNNGCKYIVLTTRHHDGFSLYDTKGISVYDVMHTPYKKDIVKEFVDACNRNEISPFLYHTMHDWQLPLFKENFKKYLKYLRNSIEILCQNYGPIGGFWFDGNWSNKEADWEEDALYSLIRKYQPNAMIINNSGLKNRGKRGHPELDTITFEQGNVFVVENNEGLRKLASESCMTVNNHWGIAYNDINYKSMKEILENITKCRKINCNYLINIAPNRDGEFPMMEMGIIKNIGIWINYVKDIYYDGKNSEIGTTGKDFVLDKNNKSYIFIHDLPLVGHKHVVEAYGNTEENNILNNVTRKIKKIYYLDNNEELLFTQKGDTVTFRAVGFQYGYQLVIRVAVIEYI